MFPPCLPIIGKEREEQGEDIGWRWFFTYCRNAGHDRSYFSEPLKMLEGKVDPPSFNMSNDFDVGKNTLMPRY